jgi:hypothetical protein
MGPALRQSSDREQRPAACFQGQVRAPEQFADPCLKPNDETWEKGALGPASSERLKTRPSARANRSLTLTGNPAERVGSCREDLVAQRSIGEENDLGSDRVSFLAIDLSSRLEPTTGLIRNRVRDP